MKGRTKAPEFVMPEDMPTTLEGKLDLALVAFGQLSAKLDHEQRQRRLIILVGSILFGLSLMLNAGLFVYGQIKTSDLEEATDQIESFQTDLCGFVQGTRQFSIESTVALQEALISAFSPDEPLSPEDQAELDRRIKEFRGDLDERIDNLPKIECEVGF